MRIKLSLTCLTAMLMSASAHAGMVTLTDTDYFANAGPLATVVPGIPDLSLVSSIPFNDGQSIGLSQPVIKDNTAVHPFEDPFVGLPGDPGIVFRSVGPLTFTIPTNAFGFYLAPNLDLAHAGQVTSVVFQLVALDSPNYSLDEKAFPYSAKSNFGRYVFFGFYGGGASVFQLTEEDYNHATDLGPDPFGYTIGYLTTGLPSNGVQSVAEPAALALLALGLAGLVATQRRRRA